MNARSIAAGGTAYLAVDGVFGAKTEAAVYYIQNRLADYGASLSTALSGRKPGSR